MTTASRKPYASDISDEEWALAAPYLTLMREDAPQREHPLRELLNGLRYVVRTGIPWRSMPHDLPRWDAVYGQAMRSGDFAARNAEDAGGVRSLSSGRPWPDPWDALAQDLRAVLRLAGERAPEPTGRRAGQPHAAQHTRERSQGRIRRRQAQARQQDPPRR